MSIRQALHVSCVNSLEVPLDAGHILKCAFFMLPSGRTDVRLALFWWPLHQAALPASRALTQVPSKYCTTTATGRQSGRSMQCLTRPPRPAVSACCLLLSIVICRRLHGHRTRANVIVVVWRCCRSSCDCVVAKCTAVAVSCVCVRGRSCGDAR